MEELFKRLYYKPEHSCQGVLALWRTAKAQIPTVSIEKCTKWLRKQRTYQLHFPRARVKEFHEIASRGINEFWQADLVDVSRYKHANSHFTFLLTIIDVESKFMQCMPLKNKSATEVCEAFKFALRKYQPKRLQTDNGSEFLNTNFLAILEKHNIHHTTCVPGDHRAMGVIERANRTIMTKVSAHLTAFKTNRYLDVLPKILQSINNTQSRTTGQIPSQYITRKKEPRKKPTLRGWFNVPLSIGDTVRLQLEHRLFEKGYTQNFSKELYKIITKTPGGFKVADEKRTYKRYELLKIEAVQDNPFADPDTRVWNQAEKRQPRRRKPELDASAIVSTKRKRKVKVWHDE